MSEYESTNLSSEENKPTLDMNKITTIQGKYSSNEKIQLYVMWQIYNKRYTVGSKLFYEDIQQKVGANKAAYSKARMFLSGAGLIVDEVVIADKVPTNLIERFGLINESKSEN